VAAAEEVDTDREGDMVTNISTKEVLKGELSLEKVKSQAVMCPRDPTALKQVHAYSLKHLPSK
jgi:hypothetical protein